METQIVRVSNPEKLGFFDGAEGQPQISNWQIRSEDSNSVAALQQAADYLRSHDIPVAFPTETVYGLGADATRSASVKGIYAAKGRPSDNPLIVHVCDLQMLHRLINQGEDQTEALPSIYKPLIERFWPGPLTILLPLPKPSILAPEVSAGLQTFGVRMPSSPLALSLIKLADKPLAAPSANASTKPSPTMAEHVRDDLDGRIELILDGGPCHVGVESTVVDGLCDPPAVLRPGGVSFDELRQCTGWEKAVKVYKDASEVGKLAPRAPGMKYKHYSPRAKVVLYEESHGRGQNVVDSVDIDSTMESKNDTRVNGDSETSLRTIGIIRTRRWKLGAGLRCDELHALGTGRVKSNGADGQHNRTTDPDVSEFTYAVSSGVLRNDAGSEIGTLYDIYLGDDIKAIARGLFGALRDLDKRGADVVFVDGIDDDLDIAAAVMNRLRKAASEIRT